MSWIAVITDQGENLLANSMLGTPVSISEVKGGTGSVNIVDLRKQTGLLDEKQLLQLDGIKKVDNSSVISVVLTNIGLQTEYVLNQVGFYADTSDGKVLFAIAQDDYGKEIIPESDVPYSMSFDFVFAFTEGADVQIVIDQSTFVTQEQFSEFENDIITQEYIDSTCV